MDGIPFIKEKIKGSKIVTVEQKEVKEFENLNPTAENIAVVIWHILRKQLNEQFEIIITLYETERNFVRYPSSR